MLNHNYTSADYEKSYPFFELFREYLEISKKHYSGYWRVGAEERLIEKIFGTEGYRFDKDTIKKRLYDTLREIDKLMPGVYHRRAEMKNLTVETKLYVSFPKVSAMFNSFLDMVDRAEVLFFKKLNGALSEEQEQEYSFLSKTLELRDLFTNNPIDLSFDSFKELYQKEGYTSLNDYAVIGRPFFRSFPWSCVELYSDDATLQRIVKRFPYLKKEMREYYLMSTRYLCIFSWSDEECDYYEMMDPDNDVYEEFYGERTKPVYPIQRIYVEKMDAEMEDWAEHTPVIKRVIGSSAKGGVRVPKISFNPFDRESDDWKQRHDLRWAILTGRA